MAELADALDLGSSGQPRGGSSPSARTTGCPKRAKNAEIRIISAFFSFMIKRMYVEKRGRYAPHFLDGGQNLDLIDGTSQIVDKKRLNLSAVIQRNFSL